MIELKELDGWAERISDLTDASQFAALGHVAIKVLGRYPDPQAACEMLYQFISGHLPAAQEPRH